MAAQRFCLSDCFARSISATDQVSDKITDLVNATHYLVSRCISFDDAERLLPEAFRHIPGHVLLIGKLVVKVCGTRSII
jgi:hypothetical protein